MNDLNTDALDENPTDRVVEVIKSSVKLSMLFVPYGSFISELVDNVIPDLRLERIVDFLKKWNLKVVALDERLKNFKSNLSSEEGIDLFEEGLLQASRAVNDERKQRLASILAHSLSSEELKYEESKKILNIFRELTDSEVIWLLYYASNPSLGNRGPHAELVERYPEVLTPLSRMSSQTKEHQKKLALQESYKQNLIRLHLVEQVESNNTKKLTVLGEMLIDYINS